MNSRWVRCVAFVADVAPTWLYFTTGTGEVVCVGDEVVCPGEVLSCLVSASAIGLSLAAATATTVTTAVAVLHHRMLSRSSGQVDYLSLSHFGTSVWQAGRVRLTGTATRPSRRLRTATRLSRRLRQGTATRPSRRLRQIGRACGWRTSLTWRFGSAGQTSCTAF